ncbi:PREDICTED: ATPase inhibitor, mitochondrial-like [Odobenus rosmarus divergens]|uniref:ATPase inhibitor, mitochondrial n=1 Tax=Odobenus rosmarus divergens TaxID=9708 RepID=A0A9B0H5V0_ODORO
MAQLRSQRRPGVQLLNRLSTSCPISSSSHSTSLPPQVPEAARPEPTGDPTFGGRSPATTTTAVTALAARVRLGMWGVRAIQARGFSSERSDSGAGSIREAGGAFGKREQAEEERYFRARTKEQLATLKKHHEEEITHHIKEIERLQKEIEWHKKIKHLKHDDDD